MMRGAVAAIGLMVIQGLPAQTKDLKAASLAELSGDLPRAFQLYKTLDQVNDPLIMTKCGHLALSLGLTEEAADFASRLMGSKNPATQQEGALLKMKILRVQGRIKLAQSLFEDYSKTYPLQKPSPAFLMEALKLYGDNSPEKKRLAALIDESSPDALVLSGRWNGLPDPCEMGIGDDTKVLNSVKIQLGVFRDWVNVQKQVQKLKDAQWVPLVETINKDGKDLYYLYVMSANINDDLKKMKTQGFTPIRIQ